MSTHVENTDKQKTQATHILKSYLKALEIPFEESAVDRIEVINKTRRVSVLVGNGEAEVSVDPVAITSFKFNTALAALHRVTEAAGYGKPMPVDRGPTSGKVNYLDNFEDVYLRHSLFRRSPNRKAEELAPYMNTVKNSARRATYRWRSVFGPMGFGENDLLSVGLVYTTSFLHNYATSANLTDNIRLLTEFLTQRFGEFAKVCYRKALNATCLPQSVHNISFMTDDDEEVSYIDRYAESEENQPDDEYMEDVFMLTFPGGAEKALRVENDGMLGLNMYLDNRLLPKTEATELVEKIRNNVVAKRRLEIPKEEAPEENPLKRRESARKELYKKLSELGKDKRTILLGYAALSRDFDPDARREARALADELACPKCEKKVASGSLCLSCGVEAVSRFGVDYIALKDQLASEHHPMAEAMSTQVPENETRLRSKRALDQKGLVALADRTVERGTKEKQPPTQEEIDAKAKAGALKDEHKALVKSMADALMATLPAEVQCPHCKKVLPKERFGIRVAKDKATGIPSRASRQSFCNPCRAPAKK